MEMKIGHMAMMAEPEKLVELLLAQA